MASYISPILAYKPFLPWGRRNKEEANLFVILSDVSPDWDVQSYKVCEKTRDPVSRSRDSWALWSFQG